MLFSKKNNSAYILAQLSKTNSFEQELDITNRLVVGPKFFIEFDQYEDVERFTASIPYLHRSGTVTYARPWKNGFHAFTGGKISDSEALAVMKAIRSPGSGQKGATFTDWTPPAEQVTQAAQAAPAGRARRSGKDGAGDQGALFRRVKRLVSDTSGVPEVSIGPDSRFIEDLGLDSLDCVELVMVIEDEFDVEVPDEDAVRLRRVSDAVAYIAKAQRG